MARFSLPDCPNRGILVRSRVALAANNDLTLLQLLFNLVVIPKCLCHQQIHGGWLCDGLENIFWQPVNIQMETPSVPQRLVVFCVMREDGTILMMCQSHRKANKIWRASRLASAAGTTGSSCANGRSRRPARLMAWTRLTPPMFSHFLVRPRRRRRRSLPDTISFLVALVIVIAMWSGGVEGNSGCKVDHCTRQFQQAAMMSGVRRGPSPAFCVILRQYSDCLRSTARSCRGHLAYHSTITLVQNWNGDFNCSYVGGGSAPAPLPIKDNGRFRNHDHHSTSNLHAAKMEDSYSNDKTVTSSSAERTTSLEPTARVYVRPEKPLNSLPITGTNVVMEASPACTYQGRPEVTHCSFYGDPHLVTFNGDFQTCKVAGAWPLIDNAYLAVSVTNEAVVPGSAATATTKGGRPDSLNAFGTPPPSEASEKNLKNIKERFWRVVASRSAGWLPLSFFLRESSSIHNPEAVLVTSIERRSFTILATLREIVCGRKSDAALPRPQETSRILIWSKALWGLLDGANEL
ncbi:hypothetical protein OUZ56_008615 [Daphnia magna]|uniref:Repulsive guidance molecule N-terminal domain-containing protein n=1 Tax=Daphnia magna TaxID=35525 RepID=A0ABR0ADI6_9CRUS|nr:hypothetical protein OUZ56_008615 [Daphnia magna]